MRFGERILVICLNREFWILEAGFKSGRETRLDENGKFARTLRVITPSTDKWNVRIDGRELPSLSKIVSIGIWDLLPHSPIEKGDHWLVCEGETAPHQRVGSRVEIETSGQRERHHHFGRRHEAVRGGIRVVPPREVPVVRGDDGVLLSLLYILAVPLPDARPARVRQNGSSELTKRLSLQTSLFRLKVLKLKLGDASLKWECNRCFAD